MSGNETEATLSSHGRPQDQRANGNQPNESVGPTQAGSTASKPPTCKFFLRQKCMHGKKGTNCKFDHPKLCFKFIKHGDMKGGCREGTKCQFVHPRLCNSYKSGVCSRIKCNFFHINGTSFNSPEEEKRPNRTLSTSSNQRFIGSTRVERRPYNTTIDDRSTQQAGATERAFTHDATDPNRYPNARDFLDMQLQMREIQGQLQQLIAAHKPQPPERVLQRTHPWGHQ